MSDEPYDPSIEPGIVPPKSPNPELITDEEMFDRKLVGDLITEEIEEEQPKGVLTEFSDEDRDWFKTLLTLGRREKTVELYGHQVRIQTLKVKDELRLGLFTKPHKGSDFYGRAHQLATCAAGLKLIDGKPVVPHPLTPDDEESTFQNKIDVLEEYYPIFITSLYEKINELEVEASKLIETLGKRLG